MKSPTAHSSQARSGQRRSRPAPGTAIRRMAMLGAATAAFSCLFVLSFGYAQHAPHPHDVRIDVVAPTGAADQIRRGLADAAPGAFDVRPVPTEAVARQHLEEMTTSGAFVETQGTVRVLTAGAQGLPLQQAINQALGNAARSQGHDVQFVDVAVLPDGDRAGLSSFALELGLLVPAVLGAVGFYLMGRWARIWIRIAGAVVYAVLAAALAALMLDAALGALAGAPWALFGDAALVASTFVLSVAALHVLLGLQGTAITAGALFVVGNAINGVAVPTKMLPDVYRQVAPWIPNNAAVHLVRSDVYFDGHDQGGPLLTLLIWLAAAVLILAATDLFHLRLRPAMPDRARQIYATPLIAHLRARKRPAGPNADPAVEQPDVAERPTTPPHSPNGAPASTAPIRIEIGDTDSTPAVVVTVGAATRVRRHPDQ